MFPLLQTAFLRFRSPRSPKPLARKRQQPQRRFETLETRHLLAANIVVSPVSMDMSYQGVGLTNNLVGEFRAVVDGELDKSPDNYTAEINWGDGSGFKPGKVVLKGQNSSSPFQVKGSHVYNQLGNYTITVRVSGNGVTETRDTGTHTVRQMPSGLAGTKPPVSESGGKQVELHVGSISTFSSYAGVGFELNNLATMRGLLNGQINKTISDYKAYVNWGDSTSWTQASLAPKLNSSYDILIKGSHVYQQAGNYRVVVYAAGPDGTSFSADTVTVVVRNMPNNFPGMTPAQSMRSRGPSDVELNVAGQNVLNANVGENMTAIVGGFNGFLNMKKETGAAASQYHAQVNWGDSEHWQQATVLANNNGSSITFAIQGSHTYQQAGTYNVVVYINGPDGTSISDQTTRVHVTEQFGDLTPSIDANKVVPTAAKDLNLNFFYGGEKVTVPVVVRNIGRTVSSGDARISLYLSTSRTFYGSATRIKTDTVYLYLLNGARKTFNVEATIPAGLSAGTKYYLIARITSVGIRESNYENNTGAASRAFEFVGKPSSNPKVFSDGTFFSFVRNTLRGTPDIPSSVNRANATSLIGHFEGARQYAYLDLKRIPTIGIGINLNTVSGTLKVNLAKAVRRYYLSAYKKRLSTNDTTVINMLKTDARAGARKIAISKADMNALFAEALVKYEKIARDTLGASTYNRLTAHQKVAILSMTYNLGSLSGLPSMVNAFKSRKLLQAGFHQVDAKRTTQAPGLTRRTGVEFANFFYGQESLLGKII